MGNMRTLPIFIALTSCWTSSQPSHPPATAPRVDVAIASVKLADDCGETVAGDAAEKQDVSSMAGDCAGDCSFSRVCEQTQLQVSVRSMAAGPTKVGIKRVELLDDSGKAIGTLRAKAATRWSNDGSYAAWDQVVAAGEVMAASWALSAPDWGALPGGRDPSRKVRVRVTFSIGDGEKTFEKEAAISAFSDPDVVT